jgi:acetolactate synthase-1/2/3 large subunit
MTGGRAVVEALVAEGIEQVFGIVGTHSVQLFDGLYDEPAVRLTCPRHEQGASLMAAGYARASGKIAACFTVPGPGLTNALTGMGMAYSESAPMLVITGQNPLPALEHQREIFHELPHSLEVAGALTSYATRCAQPQDIPVVIREAMRMMRCARPRPTFIEVPMDVLAAETGLELLPPEPYERPAGSPAALERAAVALRSAERPFILAGGGVASAGGQHALARLAEQLRIPVVTSAYAKGVIPEDHPLSLGDGWGLRHELYADLLGRADLVLAVGARFDVITDASYGARFPKRVIQIDLDPLVIGQRRQPEVGVVADARLALEALEAMLSRATQDCWFDVEAFRRQKRARLEQLAGPVLEIWDQLNAVLPRDAVVVDDLTLVGYWAPLLRQTYEPRTLLHAGTYGTLGYALPAAIGAKLACPDQVAMAIVGDGGLLYTVQELATAVAESLDLIVLLFNDDAYGAIQTYQDRLFDGRQVGSSLVNPDFIRLADAFHCRTARVEWQCVGSAVERAIAEGGTWLIEVPFAPEPPASMPPWMP